MEQILNRLILSKKILQNSLTDLIFDLEFLVEFLRREQTVVCQYMVIYYLFIKKLPKNRTILLSRKNRKQSKRKQNFQTESKPFPLACF